MNYICEGCEARWNEGKIETCAGCESPKRTLGECLCKNNYESSDSSDDFDQIELEKQIHNLSLKNEQLEEDHVEGIEATMEATANWYKREHGKETQSLLDEIKELKKENKTYKEQIKILTALIESCKSCQLQASIEIPPKQ